jgi:hypothetical protein
MTNLDDELEVCPFLTRCNPGYEDMMDFCVLNYENCDRYEKQMQERQKLEEHH